MNNLDGILRAPFYVQKREFFGDICFWSFEVACRQNRREHLGDFVGSQDAQFGRGARSVQVLQEVCHCNYGDILRYIIELSRPCIKYACKSYFSWVAATLLTQNPLYSRYHVHLRLPLFLSTSPTALLGDRNVTRRTSAFARASRCGTSASCKV